MAIASALKKISEQLSLYANEMDTRAQAYVTQLETTVKTYADDIIAELSNLSGTPGSNISVPPPGMFKITNIYVNDQGKTVVEYDDIPTP